jgi:hypothetical protein
LFPTWNIAEFAKTLEEIVGGLRLSFRRLDTTALVRELVKSVPDFVVLPIIFLATIITLLGLIILKFQTLQPMIKAISNFVGFDVVVAAFVLYPGPLTYTNLLKALELVLR